MKNLADYISETLTRSADLETCKKYIKQVFGNSVVDVQYDEKVQNSVSSKKHIKIIASRPLNDEKLWHVLNFINYAYIDGYNDEDLNQIIYKIMPNISDDVTDIIHSEKYLYHVTLKTYADKILTNGLTPKKAKHIYNDYNYQKLYVFLKHKNIKSNMQAIINAQLRKHKNSLDYIDASAVVIIIDVSKLPNDMKFFADDNFVNSKAYYTFEPISPKAISDCIDFNKFEI